jgi:hypothetical protein
MLESPVIQSRGFRNITENGKITGFQVPVRLTSYRGMFLPQLRPGWVSVGGEKFEGDSIVWEINGKSYKTSELQNYPDVHWNSQDPGILKVKKDGGLPLGIHDVEVAFGFVSSYLPPRENEGAPSPTTRRMTLVR